MLDLVVPIIVLSGQSFGKNWSIGPVVIGQMIQNAPCTHSAGGLFLRCYVKRCLT